MEVRRQDFEREVLRKYQRNSQGEENKIYYGILIWEGNDIKKILFKPC